VNETVTTALDTLGLLTLAAGCGVEVYGWARLLHDPAGYLATAVGVATLVAGVIVLVGSWLATRGRRTRGDRP